MNIGKFGSIRSTFPIRFVRTVTKISTPREVESSGGVSSRWSDALKRLKQYQDIKPPGIVEGKINNLIQHITQPTVGKIGIIYSNDNIRQKSRFIENLLSDPLSSDQIWYKSLINRNKGGINHFKFGGFQLDDNSKWTIPCDTIKGIEVVELNSKTEDAEADPTCDIYILISDELSQSTIKGINIIDDESYTPIITESSSIDFASSNLYKINSKLGFEGIIDVIDRNEGLKYFDKLSESGMIGVKRLFSFYSIKDNLINHLLSELVETKINYKSQQELKQIQEKVSHEIGKFSEVSHQELQFKFKPQLEQFFYKNFPWWKLYYNGDFLENDLKNFLLDEFMPHSIQNYNYINGKISNIISHDELPFGNESETNLLDNPMIGLRNSTIKDLSKLQNSIIKLLSFNFITYQFPLTLVSIFGFIFYTFSFNSMLSLSLLGIIIGFNNVSKSWVKLSNTWQVELYDNIRYSIKKSEETLSGTISSKIDIELQHLKLRDEILMDLKTYIEK